MKLSAVLATWNSIFFIEPCLESLMKDAPEETEFIMVDNGSSDGSPEFVRLNYPDITLVCNQQNRGVGPARNQGLRIAQGKYILVLDIDTVVRPNSLQALIEGMESDPGTGVSGAKLIGPRGELQYTCRKFPTLLSKVYRQLPSPWQHILLRDEELRGWDHSTLRYVDYVIGACQMIRRQALEEVGLYDERIFYGPEDVDFCLRMWKAGWKVLYNPQAIFVHFERRVTRMNRLLNPLFWQHAKGLTWYFLKQRYLFRPPGPERFIRSVAQQDAFDGSGASGPTSCAP